MAKNCHFLGYRKVNKSANRGNCCIFLTVQKRDGPPVSRRPEPDRFWSPISAERRNPFGQARKFPRGRVLVDHAARDSASHFGLDLLERLDRVGLLARCNRRLDGLDEGPDAADSRMVDRLATGV